ncbi:MAG: D-amino acid dehydrogenase [Pseudomonadota bacterium]
MKVIVMGAGILGVCTAWYLLNEGHEVTVIDRQREAALETSFANGAQISVSFCEPWANAAAPWKVLKWLARDDAPLLFRPHWDVHQWRWGLSFLAQCTTPAFERNVAQLVALGRYSHDTLKELVAQTGIRYDRLERGILHFFSSQEALEAGVKAAEVMARHEVHRQVLTAAQVIEVEPALAGFKDRMTGGIYTPSDESGDARAFTQALARLCENRGATFLYERNILSLEAVDDTLISVRTGDPLTGQRLSVRADAFVAALGSHTAPLLRPLGISLNIYPTKGYSATLNLRNPHLASTVSLIDDDRKIAISRLGQQVRIAGTAEMAGYDTSLDNPTARVRCAALVKRYEELFPGAADTTEPQFWAGLRPSTPSNIPCIGRSRVRNLWINAGHGTLGWTHGAGSGRAVAELISGKRPGVRFSFMR